MDELKMQQLELKYRNRFIINIMLLCTSAGLLFKSYVLMQDVSVNFFGTINMLFVWLLMIACRYVNEKDRWMEFIPYLSFVAMIFLSGSLFFNGSREAVLITAYLVVLVVAIYMRRSLSIAAYLYGMLAHLYFMPKFDVTYDKDSLEYVMFLLFFTVYSVGTIFSFEFTKYLFKKVRFAQAKTKEQLLEQEIINKELQTREELFRKNIAATSNELRVPLERIMELANELNQHVVEDMPLKIKTIMQEANQINELIRKIDALDTELEQETFVYFRPFRIDEVLRHQIDLLTPLMLEKSVKIDNQIKGSGPDKGQWPTLFADFYSVNQIIHQLLLNVIQMSSKGSIQLSASIKSTCLVMSIKHSIDAVTFDSTEAQMELDVINELISLQGGSYVQETTNEKTRELTFSLPIEQAE